MIVVTPVRLRNSILISMKIKFRFKRAICRSDFVRKSSIKTIISRKNGISMIETTMADRDYMYSLILYFEIHLYSRSSLSSTSSKYSKINCGVIKMTEIKSRKTQRMTVLVLLMTESFVKSSQMMSDYGKAWKKDHRLIANRSILF